MEGKMFLDVFAFFCRRRRVISLFVFFFLLDCVREASVLPCQSVSLAFSFLFSCPSVVWLIRRTWKSSVLHWRFHSFSPSTLTTNKKNWQHHETTTENEEANGEKREKAGEDDYDEYQSGEGRKMDQYSFHRLKEPLSLWETLRNKLIRLWKSVWVSMIQLPLSLSPLCLLLGNPVIPVSYHSTEDFSLLTNKTT